MAPGVQPGQGNYNDLRCLGVTELTGVFGERPNHAVYWLTVAGGLVRTDSESGNGPSYPKVEVIGGNIATADGARALVDHGAGCSATAAGHPGDDAPGDQPQRGNRR
jgi:hypothetical protein